MFAPFFLEENGIPQGHQRRSIRENALKHFQSNFKQKGTTMASNKYLDPPPAATRDKASFELLRVWVADAGQHVSLRSGTWEDPFAWGIVLADLARHVVNAESMTRKDLDKEAFLNRMLEGFQAEIESPTDEPEGEIKQ